MTVKLKKFFQAVVKILNKNKLAIAALNERMAVVEAANQLLQGAVAALDEQDQKLLEDIQTLLVDRIEEFQNQRDHNGNLAHPHFADVQELMGELVADGRCRSIQNAYNQAVAINLSDFGKE